MTRNEKERLLKLIEAEAALPNLDDYRDGLRTAIDLIRDWPTDESTGDPYADEQFDPGPRRYFTCPHCRMKQCRKWPLAHDNYCNGCQGSMDPPKTPE